MGYTGTGPLGVNVDNILISQFEELSTTERANQFQIKSTYGLTDLRNDVTTISGIVEAVSGLICLKASGSSPDAWVDVTTTQVGRYVPGSVAEGTIGVKFDVDSNADQRWGLYNPQSGVYTGGVGFGYNATSGLYLWYRIAGNDTIITSGNWNLASDAQISNFNPNNGHVYRIRYAWYGYGEIIWELQQPELSPSVRTSRIALHVYTPSGTTSIAEPNQPIAASIEANGETSSTQLDISGRTYGILGKNTAEKRIVGERSIAKSIPTASGMIPIISFKRRAGLSQSLRINGLDVDSDEKLLVQIRVNSELTGASYSTPTDHLEAETCTESDTSAISATGGIVVYQGLIGGSTRQSSSLKELKLPFDIPARATTTLLMQSLGGNATADVVLRWEEEW